MVSVHEAKAHFARLLERVAAGEEIVIAKSGQPVAKLVPFARAPRVPGRAKGLIRIVEDLDAPLPETVTRASEGEST